MNREWAEVRVCRVEDLSDPDCREFSIGDGDWPFRGFVVRKGGGLYAYRNFCKHAGHPLNWQPDRFLTKDNQHIICASHGALYDVSSGECIAGPCPGAMLTKVEVREENGYVIVRGPNGLR